MALGQFRRYIRSLQIVRRTWERSSVSLIAIRAAVGQGFFENFPKLHRANSSGEDSSKGVRCSPYRLAAGSALPIEIWPVVVGEGNRREFHELSNFASDLNVFCDQGNGVP